MSVGAVGGGRCGLLRGLLLLALSLVMVLTNVVPVQAQPQSPAERLDLVPKGCDVPEHKPGEFVVRYESEEVMKAAPQGNVAETYVWGPPSQRLVFEEIAKETDPKERRIKEEAKKKELEKQFGVAEGSYDEKGVDYVWGPDHSPGEFWVIYESEEAMKKAPRENVVEEEVGEGPGYRSDWFAQRLRFEEIENVSDSEERRDLEEAKIEDLQKRSGVARVGYEYPFVHQPGEFWVIYDSEEAMRVAPKENVLWEEEDKGGPGGGPFVGVQVLRFEEIRDESNPKTRRDMEEDKIRELQQRPGVRDVTYVPGDEDPDCYWDTDVTPEGRLNFANARHELYGYVCSPEGLGELFGGDGDAQGRLCGIYQSNPQACAITHRPGEFIVYYRSKKDMQTAPRANVVEEKVSENPHNEFYAQLLVFDEVKNEPDPDRQSAARVAKLQELEKRSGVRKVEYVFVGREQHQRCVDAEFGKLGGPGTLQSGKPATSEGPSGKAPAGKAPAGEAPFGELVAGKAAPGNKAVTGEPVADESSSGKPDYSGLYDYVCSPKGLKEVFGGDPDLQVWFCFPPGGGGGGGWCIPNCNEDTSRRAKKTIDDSSRSGGGRPGGKPGGKTAFDAALKAARSLGNDGNVAVAPEPDSESSSAGGSDDDSARAKGTGGTSSGAGKGASDAKEEDGERGAVGEKKTIDGEKEKGDAGSDDGDAASDADGGGTGGDDGDEPEEPESGAEEDAESAGSIPAAGTGSGVEIETVSTGSDRDYAEQAEDVAGRSEAGGPGVGGEENAHAARRDAEGTPDVWPAAEGEAAGVGGDADGAVTGGAVGDGTASDVAELGTGDGGILSFLSDSFGRAGGGPGEGDPGAVVVGTTENVSASGLGALGSSPYLILGAGALLAAGVFAARRIFFR